VVPSRTNSHLPTLLCTIMLLCATVLKRLSSKRVLAPHAGTTISFNPQPAHPSTQHTPHRPDQAASGTQQHDQTQQQQQQQRFEFQTDLLMLVAGNSRQMGRTVAVCPDALLDDGLIDFTLLSGSSLAAQVGAGLLWQHVADVGVGVGDGQRLLQ